MNDTTQPETTALATAAAGQHQLTTFEAGAMPAALALYLDTALYERVKSVAVLMSKAEGVTPKHLVGKGESCFAVVSRAITWKLDPFAVGMSTYQTPGGAIGFEGKLVQAILENSGRLDPAFGGVKFQFYGDWRKVQGKFEIKTSDRGGKYAVPKWTDEDAIAGAPNSPDFPFAQSCGVRVIAHIRGEREPRTLDFDLIQAQPRNSTLWATDPRTQITYTAVRRFANSVVPALLMGVPFDAMDNAPPMERDITPGDAITMPRARGEAPLDTGPGLTDVDIETGETTPPPGKTNEAPAPSGELPGMEPPKETAQAPAKETPKNEAPGKKASQAQRDSILNLAKRKGLTVAKLDELLVEKFSFGIDELPMTVVGVAHAMLGKLPDHNF